MPTCLAITPAKDEECLLPGLIASLTGQSIPPSRWIVIDDGSSDSTPEILDKAAREHTWIEVHHLAKDRPREAGGESVVMRFLQDQVWQHYDFILRLDADLTFDKKLLAQLLLEFAHDPHLGIGGATLLERSPNGKWVEATQPAFHTRGALKLYNRACFAAIGGLDTGLGWDTLDEMRAMMNGFGTRSFQHIQARHHRVQGTADGILKGRVTAGRAAYRIGYSPLFMVTRSIWRCLHQPYLLGGGALLFGYLDGYLRRTPKAVTPELQTFIRRQQRLRLLGQPSVWH